MSILQGELAETISQALIDAGIPYAITLTRTVVIAGNPAQPGSGETIITHHACKGFVESYSAFERSQSLIQANDAKIVVLAPTLDITPDPGTDTVTARGLTYTIISTSPDPAMATIELQGRR